MKDGDSHLHPWIEPELEARIIALVLGEASDFEAEELERLIGEQPELAMFRNRMEAIHGLLHEVAIGEPEDADDTWKLPKSRREAVLAAIEGREVRPMSEMGERAEAEGESGKVQDDPEVPVIETISAVSSGGGKRQGALTWMMRVSLAAAAGLILFVGVALVFFSFAKNEYSASAPQDMALARPEEEFGIEEDVTSYSVTRGTRTEEDSPVSPRQWASQPGAIRTEAVVAVTDGALPPGQAAVVDDAESKAASSLGRLKGVFGNMNTLAGVDAGVVEVGGMTVLSSLDVESDHFLTDQRSTPEHGAGSDGSELKMPETSELTRKMELNLAGGIEVEREGSGITIRAYSTPDFSQPISTAGKSDLSFPEVPGDSTRWAEASVGHGGPDIDVVAGNDIVISDDAPTDFKRRAFFDVNGQDLEKSQPEGGSQPGKAEEFTYAGLAIAAEAEKPENQPGDVIESKVIDESLMKETQKPIAVVGSASSTIDINGALSVAGSGGAGGTVTLGTEMGNVNVDGNISADGGISTVDAGRKDLEESVSRSKRELAEKAHWDQVGGMAERTDNYRFAPKQPAPASASAETKPAGRDISDFAAVTAVTEPVAASEEPAVISGDGGMIEVSGKPVARHREAVNEDGAVLFDPGDVAAGNREKKRLAEIDTESTPAPAELPAIAMQQSLEKREEMLTQLESRPSEQVSNREIVAAALDPVPQNLAPVSAGEIMDLEAKSESKQAQAQAQDKVPVLGDLPAAGRFFRQAGREATPAKSAEELSKLADLTAPLALRDEQRFGEFDNGMGNSVDGAYIEQPDEGNTHSLNGTSDGFTREFLGGANNLRGFDSKEVGPKSAESPEPLSEMEPDFKSGGNDDLIRESDSKTREVQITSKFIEVDESKKDKLGFGWMFEVDGGGGGGGAAPASGPAPADRPLITENQEQSNRERSRETGHGQAAPIEIAGQMKTEDQVLRREIALVPPSVDGFATIVPQPATPREPAEVESLKRDANAPVAAERNTRSKALGRSDDGKAAKQKGDDDLAIRLNLSPEVVEFEGFMNYRSPIDRDGDGNDDGLGAITDGRKSGSKRMPASKASGDEAKALGEIEISDETVAITAGGAIDASGAMDGGNVNIGGGFQGKNIEGAADEMKAHGNVSALSVSNSGAIRATGATGVGGRVILSAPGGAISNTGTIQANTPNGSGGKIQLGETLEEMAPQQSLAAIKDSLAMNPTADGATVNWSDFSVSAGEVSDFIQPGQEALKMDRVISGNPDPNVKAILDLVPRVAGAGSVSAEIQTESEPWYSKAEATKLKSNAPSAGAEWGTPMAGGDVDRKHGEFQTAQHELQRYPGHPATTAAAPVVAEGEKESAEAIQWSNSNASFGSFASGLIDVDQHIRTSGSGSINLMAGWTGDESDLRGFGYTNPTSRADINVNLTEGLLQRSGGRKSDYVQIGHGGYSTDGRKGGDSNSAATRQWKEGVESGADSLEALNGTVALGAGGEILLGTSRDSEISVLRSGANAIDGGSIDGLITSGDANVYYEESRDRTRSEFLRRSQDSWQLPAKEVEAGSRYGETVVKGGELFMIPPEGKPGDFVQLGFRDKGKAFSAQRIAPPAGLDEKNAAEESFSTFSLHVSDVSFKLAQATLAKGEWPEAGKVRIEEFVNAFDYGDPNPSQDDKVACRIEQAIHPFLQQRNLMRVAMRTAAAGRAGDTPLRLTFLLDNSGSMERADREETVRRAFALLADQLQPIDQVTLISFARQPRLLADKVSGDQSRKLVEVVANLPSEGGTNLEAALQLAFEKAQEQKADKAQNRIVLLTDGAANLGNAKPESLSRMVESMREEGIAFDAAGIGADGLNDDILEALTRKGDGRYYLLNRPEDADDGFAKQIAGALRPAAKNVKVQVEFNPDRVGNYKLLGFEKHLLKKEDFRDDSVDAAEMAAEEAGVAVYQFEAKPDGTGDVGFVSVRFRDMSSGEMVEKRWPIPYEPSAPRPDQAAPSMQIATAAALLGAKLNGEPLGETVDLDGLARTISSLPESFQSKERVQQLRQMIEQARELAAK